MADKPDDGLPPPLPSEEETVAGQQLEPGEPRQRTDSFELVCWGSLAAALWLLGLSALGVGVSDCDTQSGSDAWIIWFLSGLLILAGIVEAAIAVISIRPWRRGLGFGLVGLAVAAISFGAMAAAQVAVNANSCD
jgi:hypothetical protein